MKKLFTLVLTLYMVTIIAQTDSLRNFNLTEDLTVNYQRIFKLEDSITTTDLHVFLNTKGNMANIKTDGNTITGTIENMKVAYEKYGGNYMTTLIILNHNLDANFILERKGDRYRVTITNMVFTDTNSALAYANDNTDVNKTLLNDYVVRKRKQTFRTSNTIAKGLEYADLYFTDYFTYTKPTKDDW